MGIASVASALNHRSWAFPGQQRPPEGLATAVSALASSPVPFVAPRFPPVALRLSLLLARKAREGHTRAIRDPHLAVRAIPFAQVSPPVCTERLT